MKTALKLNKKELFSLYEKSSEQVKKSLCTEFGEDFFVKEEIKPVAIIDTLKNHKPSNKNKKVWSIDWEMIFDFSPILRIAVYTSLLLIIFS